MVNNANWLLPEGVEEILPTEALKLEMLRRKIIDDFTAKNFSLVMPPVMEFADALLSGTGTELDTQTYKFMDQQTNRMLGIRADITPQVARIDSHYLSNNEINRLCYASTVLRTKAAEMGGQRELLQCGVEVFGVAGTSADKEVIAAMLDTLNLAEIDDVTLSLAHVGIYRALVKAQAINETQEHQLQDILLRKSVPDLAQLNRSLGGEILAPFEILIDLKGDQSVIERGKQELPESDAIAEALRE
ncbi:MAG: ATP phosphoribosyltransferase regulatory subunit, partial [Acidiferrobacterales bacterium]|nr:ATP phosphoribosyltransferase regulatory subunit [Acidiferrobacterales bacterium]